MINKKTRSDTMGLLRYAAFAAAGYGLSSLINSNKQTSVPNNASDNIEDIILDYAHRHDIWGYNQDFYNRLMYIADQFRDPFAD